MKLIIFFISLSLFISQKSMSSVYYQCFDKSGRVIFSDNSCPKNSNAFLTKFPNIIQSVKPHTRTNSKVIKNNFRSSNYLSVIDKNTKYLNTLKREQSSLISDLDRRTLPYGKTRGQLSTRLRYVESEIKRISDFLYHYKKENNIKGTTGFTLGK